jgi:BioD-like phosphotransacetylase family protein
VRQLYLAATGQNRGKTTVALGVLDGSRRRGLSTAFIKPVGQRWVEVDGVAADEDAVLMRSVFQLTDPLGLMSPVHIPRGFTRAYVDGRVVEDLPARIVAAHAEIGRDRDLVLIEGTGHAGVGAVVGLSNAVVAALLDAPAIIVSEGGVGRPIDEIVLNAALFERHGVEVAGAIVNKVDLDAKPGLAGTLERGLARHGIPLLGVLPYRRILSNPSLAMVLEGVGGELLHPGPDLDLVIGDIAVGAMQPEHMLSRIGPGTLVIVPGDREDVIRSLCTAHLMGPARSGTAEAARAATSGGSATRGGPAISSGPASDRSPDWPGSGRPDGGAALGLVLTGGYRPRATALEAIRSADLFAVMVPEDTYPVASEIHDLLVKTHPSDAGKIEEIKSLVWDHMEIDRVLGAARPPRTSRSP